MSVFDGGQQGRRMQPGPLRWPRRHGPGRGPDAIALFAYLLDIDGELADEFDARTRVAARQLATARVLHAATGDCDLLPWFALAGEGLGLLILEGLLAVETRVDDRVAAELVGPGDLLAPPDPSGDELLSLTCGWRALIPTRLALLDGDFAERTRPFPQIHRALLHRACRRPLELDVLRAITSQPRLENRLVLLLWHLAARWGRVEPGGVRLMLPLTHRLLGQLISAERPSVSHALKRLAHAGLVTGPADDLHLHENLEFELQALAGRPGAAPEHAVSPRTRRPRRQMA